jgi:hypothetical protein
MRNQSASRDQHGSPRCTTHAAPHVALPNCAIFRIKAAPAAPLARLLRRALPWGGPPGASRATAATAADQMVHRHAERCCARPSSSPPNCPSRDSRVKGALRASLRDRHFADPGPGGPLTGAGSY